MEIDLSTHQIAEATYDSLSNSNITLDGVLTVWHELGNVIRKQLLINKGVRLDKFGTFSFNHSGDLCFNLHNDFSSEFKVKQKVAPALDNIPTTKLNLTQLSNLSKLDRDDVNKIYSKFILFTGKGIQAGRNILLSFHKVAEISIKGNELKCLFIPEFVEKVRYERKKLGLPTGSIGSNKAVDQQNYVKDNKNSDYGNPFIKSKPIQRDQIIDVNSSNKTRYNSRPVTPINLTRDRNPITGENGSEVSARQIKERDRNPITGEREATEDAFRAQKRRSSNNDNNMRNDPINQKVVPRSNIYDDRSIDMIQKTGDGKANRRPSSARSVLSSSTNGTRPSASTLSLLHSPGSRHSSAVSQKQRRPTSSSGLRKDNLDRLQKNQVDIDKEIHNRHPSKSQIKPAGKRAGGSSAGSVPDARRMAAVALDKGSGDIIKRVRDRIIERGGDHGIRSLGRLLAIMDDNGDKRLSKDELRFGLRDFGVNITPVELEQLMLYFDRDKNGVLDFNEFLVGMRGDLNPRRKKLVRMAFDILDTDKSGVVTMDELFTTYNVNANPAVRSGALTPKQAMREFMAQWDRDKNDTVTYDEFEDYYKDLSASIDGDDYFELMIRNSWRIAGGEGVCENTANRRVLVTRKDGKQEVVTVKNEWGMKGDDKEDIRRRLQQQGEDVAQLELSKKIDATDKAKRDGRKQVSNVAIQSINNPPNARNNELTDQPRSTGNDYYGKGLLQMGNGDESFPHSDSGSRNNAAGSKGRPSSAPPKRSIAPSAGPKNNTTGTLDVGEILKKLLYTPPVSLEQLAIRLQISIVDSAPSIPKGAFIQRMSTLDSTLSKSDLATLWAYVDSRNVGTVEVEFLHSLLAGKFGKDKSAKPATVVDKVLARILERTGGEGGFRGLQRCLATMDDSGDKKLTKEEFKFGMRDYGIDLNQRELEDVFFYFDRDKNGFIDFKEFLVSIRGDLNPRRKKLVRMAFDILDTDKSGVVTVNEMIQAYDVSKNPAVIAGTTTPKQAMREFMAQWDRDKNDTVTYDEFEDYYKDLSASIDGDDYFELMIRNSWRIAGGGGVCENTANRRVLVTRKDGMQEVVTVKNEWGMKGDDKEDIRRRLQQQGEDVAQLELSKKIDATDKAKRDGGRQANPPNHEVPKVLRVKEVWGERPNIIRRPNSASRPRPLSSPIGSEHSRREVLAVESAAKKHWAAMKLAATFRGHKGRQLAQSERRKAIADQQRREEEEAEANRPKPRDILRPKGKSYIGF